MNEDFFKKWSRVSVYILGFIAADGNITKRNDRKDSYMLNMTSKDKNHLEAINKVLGSHYSIGSKKSGYTNKKEYYVLQISNKKICFDLLKLGIIPRKTYIFSMPKVPKKYFADFVRGFFDGDGTVYTYSVNNSPQIKAGFVSCSKDFIEGFNHRLCDRLGILEKTVHKTISKGKKYPQYTIHFYINDCSKLASLMYKNDPILFLKRKRKIFQDWESVVRRHYIKKNYPSKIGWKLNSKLA